MSKIKPKTHPKMAAMKIEHDGTIRNRTAIFLFDNTGIMALPWADAGVMCYCFDGQHPPGISDSHHPRIKNVGLWFDNDHTTNNDLNIELVNKYVSGTPVFVFGFPECTDLASSGAAWFVKKTEKDPHFQDRAMKLVHLVKEIGEEYGCPWGLENPVGRISSLWRKPDFTFDPWFYGGHLPADDEHPQYPEHIKPRDAYPKRTCVWHSSDFNKPSEMPVKVMPGYSEQHKKLGGKSLKTKNIRSATPRGFAKAVYLSNNKLGIKYED
jgi:hypothetical protein